MMVKQKWFIITIVSLLLAIPAMAQNGNEYYQKVYDRQSNSSYFVPVSQQSMRNQYGINEYGIAGGDFMLSVQGGYARSVNKVEDGLEWGKKGGGMVGASVLFFPASVIGVGVEYNSNHFAKEDTGKYCTGPGFLTCISGKSQVRMDNLMFALRFNVNPNHRARFYIPLGAGIDFLRVKETISGAINETETRKYKDFAWYAGVGFETSITKNFFIGLEARMNGSHDTHKDGAKPLIYASGLGRIGFKF